jgi:EmrB/QacA subfamily drug resistance transporter
MRPEPNAAERRTVLIGIFLCMFLSALDQTIVSTALPRIVQDLGGTNLYAWVATSYLLASTIALPVAGRLADMVSPKWILVVAASAFLLGSALSGLSTSMPALIAFRGLQGLGGGAIFAVVVTVIGLLYPPRERGRLQGLFGAVFGIASVIGPYLGGVLTDDLSWRWVFYVNMPFGAIALYVLLAHMPSLAPARRQRFDYGGAGALLLWTVPMLLALSWGGSTYAWTSPQVLALFGLTAIGLAVFYTVERLSAAPLFDLTLLKLPVFTWAGIGTLFFGAAFLGSVLFLPLYLVEAKGISPSQSGLTLTPLTLGVVVGSFLAGQMAARIGRYKGLLIAGTVLASGVFLAIYAVLGPTLPLSHLLVLLVALGLGLGPSFPLYTLAVQNAVRREQLGVASSGNQFMRQIGSAAGAALMGAVLVGAIHSQMAARLPASASTAMTGGSLGASNLEGRAQIEAQIDTAFTRLARTAAAALRGDRAAYRALARDPNVPAAYRRQLVPGGIPAAVREETGATAALVARAVRGDPTARARVANDAALPARVRLVALHPPASPAAQARAIASVDRALAANEPAIVRATEARVVPSVERRILAAGAATSRAVLVAVTDAVSAGVRRVFGLAAILALAALAAALLLPGAELRRHHQGDAAWLEETVTPPAEANAEHRSEGEARADA